VNLDSAIRINVVLGELLFFNQCGLKISVPAVYVLSSPQLTIGKQYLDDFTGDFPRADLPGTATLSAEWRLGAFNLLLDQMVPEAGNQHPGTD